MSGYCVPGCTFGVADERVHPKSLGIFVETTKCPEIHNFGWVFGACPADIIVGNIRCRLARNEDVSEFDALRTR